MKSHFIQVYAIFCQSRWENKEIILKTWNYIAYTEVKNQQTRELISAQKMSHADTTTKTPVACSNSPCMQVNTRYVNSTRGTSSVNSRYINSTRGTEFIYLVFTHMPGEGYSRWQVFVSVGEIFWVLINSVVCWFCTIALSHCFRFNAEVNFSKN